MRKYILALLLTIVAVAAAISPALASGSIGPTP
jgi:hypothetical protein